MIFKKKSKIFYRIIFINTILIFITGFAILFFTWINSEKTANNMAEKLINEILNATENKSINYFQPAEQAVREMVWLFNNNKLDMRKPDETLPFFKELQRINNRYQMIYFADTQGNLIMSRRMPDGSFSRRFVTNDGKSITTIYYHENAFYYGDFPNTVVEAEKGYDPRKRVWYSGALQAQNVSWTKAYIFATDKYPGVTCSAPVYDSAGNLKGIVAVDIAVAELSMFLGTIQPTPGARIVMLDSDDNIIAFQAKEQKDLESLFKTEKDASGAVSYLLVQPDALKDEAIRSAFAKTQPKNTLIHFTSSERISYIGKIKPITTQEKFTLNIALFIPENDVIGNVRRSAVYVVIFSLGMIAFSLVISVFLSMSISNPMKILSGEMEKIKDFIIDADTVINTSIHEIDVMNTSFNNMKKGLKSFRRYVPADLVAELINEGAEAGIGGDNRELTLFFSDIEKFTSISEGLAPEQLVSDLCEYFDTVSKTIIEFRGTIDKYIGDSVMAFWGAPKKMDNAPEMACTSALAIRDRLSHLFMRWSNHNKPIFNTRIGLHTGDVIVGNMGYSDRLNYTAIGDAVNLASRLEGLNKYYGTSILLSDTVKNKVMDKFEFRRIDKVTVVGRTVPIEIYELISAKDDITPQTKKLHSLYEDGLNFYFEQNWDNAIRHFATVLKYKPEDKAARVMQNRSLKFRSAPPAPDWDGIFVVPAK